MDSNHRVFRSEFTAPCNRPLCEPPIIKQVTSKFGGSCGIRTHGAVTPDSFQDCCLKPLGQASIYGLQLIWWTTKESNLTPTDPSY